MATRVVTNKCQNCGKTAFLSEKKARAVRASVSNSFRVYRCGPYFHITAEKQKLTGRRHKKILT